MTFKRHTRWAWFFLGTLPGDHLPTKAYVMDDFGSLVEIDNSSFYSIRAGCSC